MRSQNPRHFRLVGYPATLDRELLHSLRPVIDRDFTLIGDENFRTFGNVLERGIDIVAAPHTTITVLGFECVDFHLPRISVQAILRDFFRTTVDTLDGFALRFRRPTFGIRLDLSFPLGRSALVNIAASCQGFILRFRGRLPLDFLTPTE